MRAAVTTTFQDGRPAEALDLALKRQGVLLLGRAQRGAGLVELGTATLRGVFGEIRSMVLAEELGVESLAAALNLADDMWEGDLAELPDRPELVCRLGGKAPSTSSQQMC